MLRRRMPRVLLDVAEIYEVQQRAERGVDKVVELPAFLVCESLGLDELRRALEILLEKHRRLDAAWVSLKDRGTIFEMRHDVVRDSQIKAEQIKLRELLVGPVDAIQTRDRNVFPPNLQNQIALRFLEAQKLLRRDECAALLTRPLDLWFLRYVRHLSSLGVCVRVGQHPAPRGFDNHPQVLKLRLPAEFAFDLVGTGNQDRRITRTTWSDANGNLFPGNLPRHL